MSAAYSDFASIYDQLKDLFVNDVQSVGYEPKSRAELRAELQAALLPTLESAIANRQLTTSKNNAAVDADAAARGIGASTWGTDVKNRNNTAEAKDIASLKSAYSSDLASNLNDLLSSQEQMALSNAQYNASAKNDAISNALQAALENYSDWGDTSSHHYGSGGGDSATGTASAATGAKATSANPYAYTNTGSKNTLAQSVIAAYKKKNQVTGTAGAAVK